MSVISACTKQRREAWPELLNDYTLSLKYRGETYRSSAHLFHALKFMAPDCSVANKNFAALIRAAHTPADAAALARQDATEKSLTTDVRRKIENSIAEGAQPDADWNSVLERTVALVLNLKFTQDVRCLSALVESPPDLQNLIPLDDCAFDNDSRVRQVFIDALLSLRERKRSAAPKRKLPPQILK
jgi:hypothetical protein